MAMEVALREVLGSVLGNDTLDYVSGMLDAETAALSLDELVDLVGPFLADAGAPVRETCEKLLQRAAAGAGEGAPPSPPPAPPPAAEAAGGATEAGETVAAEAAVSGPRAPICAQRFLDGADNFSDPYLGLRKLEVNFNQQIPIQEAVKLQQAQQRERERQARMLRDFERSKLALPAPRRRHGTAQASYEKVLDIIVPSFSVAVAGRDLLKDASLKIAVGRKYGLIGRNGIGKSTFLGALVRKDIPGLGRDLSISCVEQELQDRQMGESPLEAVLAVDSERTALLESEAKLMAKQEAMRAAGTLTPAEEASLGEQLAGVFTRLDEIDGAAAPAEAAAILVGLGFTIEMQHQPIKSLSGGWRVRVALARALFSAPDLLCLDEPTNHLDLHAVAWLTTYLRSWPTACIIVSHSRSFLNDVCSDIIDFRDQKLHYYRGDFDTFERSKAELDRLHQRKFEAQELKRAHMQSFIDRFRAKTKTAKMVQSRIKALEKLPQLDAYKEDASLVFTFPTPEQLPTPVLELSECWFRYGSKGRPGAGGESDWILKEVDLSIDFDSRIAICGVNGSGKTTLLKLVCGQLEPTRGYVRRHNRLRIGLFSQHHVDQLDITLNAVQQLQQAYPNDDIKVEAARAYLGKFGIGGLLALEPLYILSGGQKSRVAIALMAYTRPHILVLDEPTNHLDLDAVQALIAALNDFEGGLVVVSHDVHLLSCVVDRVLYVSTDSHRLVKYDGDIFGYQSDLLKRKIT